MLEIQQLWVSAQEAIDEKLFSKRRSNLDRAYTFLMSKYNEYLNELQPDTIKKNLLIERANTLRDFVKLYTNEDIIKKNDSLLLEKSRMFLFFFKKDRRFLPI